jgi:hypothetical protein
MEIISTELLNTSSSYLQRTQYTWRDYEVPGMLLLHDLKEAMRHDSSKDMSACVSSCTNYDFNALTPVVWKLCVSTSSQK